MPLSGPCLLGTFRRLNTCKAETPELITSHAALTREVKHDGQAVPISSIQFSDFRQCGGLKSSAPGVDTVPEVHDETGRADGNTI